MLGRLLRSAIVFGGLLTMCAGVAQAGLETVTIQFTGSGFSNSAPVDPVTGMVTITLDPTVDETDQTAGITLDSLNIPLDSAIAYTYLSSNDTFEIGGIENHAFGTLPGTNDIVVLVHEATTAPFIEEVAYTDSGDSFHHVASSRFVTVTVSDVPEPATLLLLSLAVAAVLRARRRLGRPTRSTGASPAGPIGALSFPGH